MGREIKFRGLRKSGEWLFGNLVQSRGEVFITKKLNEDNAFFHANVRNETVGQFTGLKDKNGVDIYEGDIVSVDAVPNPVNCEVSFQNGCFVGAPPWNRDDDNKCPLSIFTPMTVIGNIYENPELLNPEPEPVTTTAANHSPTEAGTRPT